MKTASVSQQCGCGCGADVSREFLPGHDAKLKSRLVNEALEGSTEAEAQLRERGWMAHLDLARASQAAKREKEKDAEIKRLRAAVRVSAADTRRLQAEVNRLRARLGE